MRAGFKPARTRTALSIDTAARPPVSGGQPLIEAFGQRAEIGAHPERIGRVAQRQIVLHVGIMRALASEMCS